jgi:acetyl esterase/lipase
MTLWSNQPFKALYGLFFGTKVLVLLPLSLIRYTPKSARPSPDASLRICVVNAIARELFRYYTATRSTGVGSVAAGHKRAKERFALAEPADASLYEGVLSPGDARPASVGGIWYPSPPSKGKDMANEKVVLHCPGGAFVLAFGTEENGQEISKVMTQYLNVSKTFLAQYRVSSDEQTRFPSAIQDLVTFYHYVLSLGVHPDNIILSGDSAAGNLVLGLLRYLEDVKSPRLPLPAGVMLWSPWVHVTPQAGRDYEDSKNAQSDLLIGSLLQWGADAYLPEGKPASDVLPFISPLHHPFKTSVPVYIHAGGGEGFFDQIKDFAQEMDGMDGNRIRFHATDLAPHNLLMSAKGLGLDHEMEVAAKDAYSFFEQAE